MKRTIALSLAATVVLLPVAVLAASPASVLGQSLTQEPAQEEAAAAEQEELPTRRYVLKDGKAIRAAILGSEGDRVRLEVRFAGGSGARWYDISAFKETSQVNLRRELVAEGDLSGQLAVAEFAADKGLVDESRRELRRVAQMADSTGQPLPAELTGRAISLVETIIVELCRAGRVGEARHGVSRLVTRQDGELTDAQKQRFVKVLDDAIEEREQAQADERRAKRDAKVAAEIDRKLKPIYKDIKDGAELRRKGLLGSRKRSSAKRDLAKSVAKFESALKKIDRLEKSSAGDTELRSELGALRQRAYEGWRDALLAGASLDLSLGRFNESMEAVNTILADHPKDKEALAMRARIEVAANDWGWWN